MPHVIFFDRLRYPVCSGKTSDFLSMYCTTIQDVLFRVYKECIFFFLHLFHNALWIVQYTWKGDYRGFRGGFEGVQWGIALGRPSKGPRNPLGRPSEPPVKYEQIMVKNRLGFWPDYDRAGVKNNTCNRKKQDWFCAEEWWKGWCFLHGISCVTGGVNALFPGVLPLW